MGLQDYFGKDELNQAKGGQNIQAAPVNNKKTADKQKSGGIWAFLNQDLFGTSSKKKNAAAVPVSTKVMTPVERAAQFIMGGVFLICFGILVAGFVAFTGCATILTFMGGLGLPFLLGAIPMYFYLRLAYRLFKAALDARNPRGLIIPMLMVALPLVFPVFPTLINYLFSGF